jgi:hypothetical protein
MQTEMDKQLFGDNMLDPSSGEKKHTDAGGPSRYLALHMRFEVDMVAYSLCEFGGGEEERRELHAFRETHFPALAARLRNTYAITNAAVIFACFRLIALHLPRTSVVTDITFCGSPARCRRRSSGARGGAR